MQVDWRPRAVADLRGIARFIAPQNPVAASRIVRELLLAGNSLADFPQRGRAGRRRGTRELVIVKPYILVYRVDAPATVIILRIWHAAQDRT